MCEQYPSDLMDGQWQVLRGLLPRPAKRGRRPICRRLILNAILYVNRTGCQWRALPHDFPKWKTVYTIFWRWRRAGVWQRIHEALCRQVRKQSGKKPTPSVAIVDSVISVELIGPYAYGVVISYRSYPLAVWSNRTGPDRGRVSV